MLTPDRRFEAPRCRSLCSNGAARLPSAKGPAPRHSESQAIRSLATTTCWERCGASGEVKANRRAFGLATTRLSREARSSFRRPSMATEIGSPPIHGPLPRFPLAAEPPHQDLTAPPLRRRQKQKRTPRTVIPAKAGIQSGAERFLLSQE